MATNGIGPSRVLKIDDRISEANAAVLEAFFNAEPVLIGLEKALDVVPAYKPNLILASGPAIAWGDYVGGQRDGIIGGAIYEGLAVDAVEAVAKLDAGEILVGGCQDYGCVGSLAGIYTASMPVFIVENRNGGNRAYCSMYEGSSRRRLNYGVYDEDVHRTLSRIALEVAPVIARCIKRSGGIVLKEIMARALRMGDELHSRNVASSMMFSIELMPYLLSLSSEINIGTLERALFETTSDQYFFLRVAMAASKVIADNGRDIPFASIVSAMAITCSGFAIKVSGLGDEWFTGPYPDVDAVLFDGYSLEDIAWMGGESVITETVGLGAFAQSSAPALQKYLGGTFHRMIENNRALYGICAGEHRDFLLPGLDYRGSPVGIDIFKVVSQNTLPPMNVGIAGRDGGQIGAGVIRAPRECFVKAVDAFETRYK